MINPKKQRKLDRIAAQKNASLVRATELKKAQIKHREEREARLNQVNETRQSKFSDTDFQDVKYAKHILKQLSQTPAELLDPTMIGFLGSITKFKSVLKQKVPLVNPRSKYSVNGAIELYAHLQEFKEIEMRLRSIQIHYPQITRGVVFGMIKEIWEPKK